jgi:hypothetical protein
MTFFLGQLCRWELTQTRRLMLELSMVFRGESEEVLDVPMDENRVEKSLKLMIIEKEEKSITLEDNNVQLDKQLKGLLPVVCCECGVEILLVPDLKAMDLAIKAHVAAHKLKERKVDENARSSGKISQLLSQLTLKKVIEVRDSKFSAT